MDPREHLLKAADDMAKYGQAKEAFYDKGLYDLDWRTAPACAYGSLCRTADGQYVSDGGVIHDLPMTPAVHRLANTIRAKLDRQDMDDYQAITFYNDMDSTSQEDMILTFKEAAHG